MKFACYNHSETKTRETNGTGALWKISSVTEKES